MNRFYELNFSHLLIVTSLICTLFILPIVWLVGHSFANTSPTMRQAVSQISQKVIVEALETEIPYLRFKTFNSEDPPMPLSLYLFETLTSLNPMDLTTFFSSQIPGLSTYNGKQIQSSTLAYEQNYIVESPAPTIALNEQEAGIKESETKEKTEKDDPKMVAAPEKERMVFIYNTHNTESWTFAANNPPFITDDKVNVMMVSKQLEEELKKRGIKASFDATDHQKRLEKAGLSYTLSYAESLKTVKAAVKQNKDIGYIIDIHRDSATRKSTTVTIDGKTYARIAFVIGKGNAHWKKNQQLAETFDKRLNEKYPDISRGIHAKSSAEGNGEYNQSISPNSLLIEIGGIENTLEESMRTTSALADIIADLYFEDAKKVDAPATPTQKQM
ncbi:stage II sporulation protein P [Ammoniphilus resinae]|uniref:Stage II sporulation protein P n=1 Tax=Ammoniphilus resinae TaxID=861532 RepID=A0ABS4GN45_9BACL|nr:stage II sporulation protein P [Ammoniphilus resinae]MBP1931698.1 stage II sporulation protein P [Ammoniphilus resinae]